MLIIIFTLIKLVFMLKKFTLIALLSFVLHANATDDLKNQNTTDPSVVNDLSGTYTLANMVCEQLGLDKDKALKNALFYAYLDGRSFVIETNQTAVIEKNDTKKIATFELQGNELKINYFNQGNASFNGSKPQPANSYSTYQFSKTNNGFTISSEDPASKESYTFVRIK